jgi:hypothetical protein
MEGKDNPTNNRYHFRSSAQAENNMKGSEKDKDPKKERTGQTSQA